MAPAYTGKTYPEDINTHLAVHERAPDRERVRQIQAQFPVIGAWVHDKRACPWDRTDSRATRWQFIGTR